MQRLSLRLAVFVCVASCAVVAALESWPARSVRTDDQNGDGRPDIWRRYDTRGRLTEVDVDTNFDGSPDIAEYYDRGVLVRRETDRNFNGQADLVEEFDARTHNRTRSVVDLDYDGTADLLVLFRDGQPVFARQTPARDSIALTRTVSLAAGDRDDHLARLIDPFDSETNVRAAATTPGDEDCVAFSTSGGLPCPRTSSPGRLASSSRLVAGERVAHTVAPRLPWSSRAPPVS